LAKDQGGDCCGILKLTVIDKTTNTPIANAEVKITRTDNNFLEIKKTGNTGEVEFTKLCMGKYWVRVAGENYKVVEDYVYIENCDKAVEKTIKLESKNNTECCDNNINFIVKDAEGNPLTGVKIKLIQSNTIKKTLETQNGTASTGKIMCKGSYKIVMMKESYKTIEFETSVDCSEDITIDKKLEGGICCDAQIKISVQDAENEEVLNGAKVKLWKDGKIEREGTVENGYVWFKELCEGKYGISIMHEGYNGMEFQYEISCKNDNYLVKKLSKK
jgi:5-hydroxyisourate hydrolase-like protein (transthyretin family)